MLQGEAGVLSLCEVVRREGEVYAPVDLAFRSQPLAAHRVELGVGRTNPELSDVHQIVVPWRAEVYRAFRDLRWPLWNSSSACGEHLAGSAQPAAYSLPVLAGLLVQLTGFLLDCRRTNTLTRYYRALRIGGHPGAMCWETQAVHLVPKSHLSDFLTSPYDAPLLQAILADKR